jgi:alginate O-acetyltransferase complex protein AlgI
MLFNSIEYGLFLTVVLAVYFRLGHRQQNLFLLAASYLFYSFWDWRFLSLILFSTSLDFVVGRRIQAARGRDDGTVAKRWLIASLIVNLGFLGVFKYFGFFVESLNALLGTAGLGSTSGLLAIVLPVGISFYTFESMSYTIDIYRGEIPAVDDPVDFALFVAFFPHLVAGPIMRAGRLMPQIQHPRVVTRSDWEHGLCLILVGLVRKVAIADTAGGIVDGVFASPLEHTSLQLGAVLVLYAIQIYGDFAGYSDIARGSARLLGFDIMRNFRHPYFATNPTEFWRRWHISLSTWMRDYVYIPLGGSRKGPFRTHLNLLVTMVLSGLWHGAAWHFVLWGFAHGLLLAGHRALRAWRGTEEAPLPSEVEVRAREQRERWAGRTTRLSIPLGEWMPGLATFAAVTLLFLLFRGGDMDTIALYLEGLTAGTFGGQLALIPVLVLGGLLMAIDVPQAITDDEYAFMRFGTVPTAALAAIAVLLVVFGGRATQPFIYFQF